MKTFKNRTRANLLSCLCLLLAVLGILSLNATALAGEIIGYDGSLVWSINESVVLKGHCYGGCSSCSCSILPYNSQYPNQRPSWLTGGGANGSAYSNWTSGQTSTTGNYNVQLRCPTSTPYHMNGAADQFAFKVVDIVKVTIDGTDYTSDPGTIILPVDAEANVNISVTLTYGTGEGDIRKNQPPICYSDFMSSTPQQGNTLSLGGSDQLTKTISRQSPGVANYKVKAGNGTEWSFTIWVVGVAQQLDYKIDTGAYSPAPNPWYLAKNTVAVFKCYRDPSNAPSWPSGYPVWDPHYSTHDPHGDTDTVTFNYESTADTDCRTVTAICGDTDTDARPVIYTAELTARNSGTTRDFAHTVRVAAGGLSTAAHKADLKVVMTPPLSGIQLQLGNPYRAAYPHGATGYQIQADAPATLTTGQDGTVTDTDAFTSSDVIEDVCLEIHSPEGTHIDTDAFSQQWDSDSPPNHNWGGDEYFWYEEPCNVTFSINLARDYDETDTGPLEDHQIEFKLTKIEGWKWDSQIEDYKLWVAYDTDAYTQEQMESAYGGYIIEPCSDFSDYVEFNPSADYTNSYGTASTQMTVHEDPDCDWFIDGVYYDAVDLSVWGYE